jgi:uncharacterized protein
MRPLPICGITPVSAKTMEAFITDQVAALPFRFDDDGNVEVMLITSRSGSQHWIPPKGHLIVGKKPHEAAAEEAYEEAGVVGRVSTRPLGKYSAIKLHSNGLTQTLNVTVFAMQVLKRARDWPERGQRTILWFEPADAAKAVREPELARLIAHFQPARAP